MAESHGRILNVDDYEPARYARTEVLRRAGFDVTEVSTGAEALRRIAAEHFDLVLLDVDLPDIDGFEVCRRIRERLGTLTLPIVHICATFVNEQAHQLAREGGADAFMTEPVEPPVLLATVRALLRIRRAEEGLRAAGRRWQATFDAIPDGLCLLTAEGGVVQCNAAFAKLIGRDSQDELVGMPWLALWQSFGPAGASEPLAGLAQTRQRETLDLTRNGSWFQLVVDPVIEGGELTGLVATVSNTTIERQVRDARAALLAREQAAREEAEAANNAKDEFLAMLGHELRNPLDVVASAVHVLDAISWQEPRAVHTRKVIALQVRQLARLVDDLLDLSRVTTGKIGLAWAPVDLAEIANGCAQTLTASGHSDTHELRVDTAPTWVNGDRSRLEQIVMNLLSNALKYTPPGGAIAMSVRGDGTTARLVVEDSGAGIAPDVLERIFDLFYQGRRTLDRAEGGLGIGLTLVRRLVDMHGGHIQASSKGPGTGSTFVIELPQIRAAESPPAPALHGPITPRRIVLVEDNHDSREMLKYLLELAGHEVHEAASGPAGLDAITRLLPEVAFVDLGLPGFDGFELARRVRASAGGRGVRLVALTGYGLPDDHRRSHEAGFDTHLVKPIDPVRLTAVIAGGGP